MNYKGKRMGRTTHNIVYILSILLLLFSLVVFTGSIVMNCILSYQVEQELKERHTPKTVYYEPGGPKQTSYQVDSVYTIPDPRNDYDWEYILCMVAAEIQTGSKENQMALAQCVRNTSERDGRSIGQVLQEDYSAKPCDPSIVSESIKDTCYRIFVLHETVIPTNVEVMYSTSGGFYSPWHESQQFEFQIEGIKYFSIPIYNQSQI